MRPFYFSGHPFKDNYDHANSQWVDFLQTRNATRFAAVNLIRAVATMSKENYVSECKCGTVRYEATARPACNVVCYCDDCQSAGRVLVEESGCENPLDPDGGTSFSTFLEKDWKCVAGAEQVESHKLRENSPTTRFIASCCQTPIYLKYGPGFWVSTFRAPFTNELPKLNWRIKTSHRTSSLPFPDDIARFKGFPLRLYAALYRTKWRR